MDSARYYLEPEHRLALLARLEYSSTLFVLGERQKAIAAALSAYQVLLRQSLPGDPELLSAKRWYVQLLLFDGNIKDGAPLAEELVCESQRDLGDNHSITVLSNLTWIGYLQDLGKWSKAEPIFDSMFDRYKIAFGSAHPNTFRALELHADLLDTLRDRDKSYAGYSAAFEMRKHTQGPEHPDAILCEAMVHRQKSHMSSPSEAVPILEDLLKRLTLKVPPENYRGRVLLIDCKLDLAQTLFETNRTEEGEEFFWLALNDAREFLGRGSYRVLRIESLFGEYLFEKKHKANEAEFFLKKSVETRRQSLGSQHPYIFTDMMVIADCEARQEKFNAAKSTYMEIIAAYEEYYANQPEEVRKTAAGLHRARERTQKVVQTEMDRKKSPKSTYYRPMNDSELFASVANARANRGYSEAPRGVTELAPLSSESELCLSCQSITLERLDKAKVKLVYELGGGEYERWSDYSPLTVVYDNPLKSKLCCPLCRLILSPDSPSAKLTIELEAVVPQKVFESGKFDTVNIRVANNEASYPQKLRVFAHPG